MDVIPELHQLLASSWKLETLEEEHDETWLPQQHWLLSPKTNLGIGSKDCEEGLGVGLNQSVSKSAMC